MSTTIHREAVVGPDGKIEITAPELQPGQRVSITIQPEPEQAPVEQKRSALDILSEAPGHQLFQTAEEVDAYIREERDSSER
jgi:hypothetical protein